MGLPTLGREWVLTPSEGVQVHRGLVREWGDNGTWDSPENRSSGVGIAFALPHRCDEKRAEPEGKALDLPVIFVPTLIYGHECWVMTQRTRSRVQAAKMGFLRRVAGVSLRDRVRSSVILEGLGGRAAAPLRWKEPAEMVRASSKGCPLGASLGRCSRHDQVGRRPRGRPRTRWRDYISTVAW